MRSDGQQQAIRPVRLFQMTFFQIETSTFDIRKEGFNSETFRIPAFALGQGLKIGDKEPVFLVFSVPGRHNIDRSDLVLLGQ